MPDGLLLSYPAVILDRDFYSPSYLISLDDYIISHSFIKLCAESYVRGDPKTDPLLSPLVCDL